MVEAKEGDVKGSSKIAKTPRRVGEEYGGTMELSERELVVPDTRCDVLKTHPDREHLDHHVYRSA